MSATVRRWRAFFMPSGNQLTATSIAFITYSFDFITYSFQLITYSFQLIMFSFQLITFSINFYALSIPFESAFNSIWMPFQFYLKGLSIPFLRAQKIFPHVLCRCEIEVNSFPFALCRREYAVKFIPYALSQRESFIAE